MSINQIYKYLKRLLSVLLFIGISIQSSALPNEADTIPRKRVGLVLSGGGAKGFAHVGILKAIEKAGIPIDYIAGTSMGAIAGGLYSIGFTADDLEKMILAQNWTDILLDASAKREPFIFSIPMERAGKLVLPKGFLGGESVIAMLNETTLGYHEYTKYDSLPIPFACVAFDLVSGKDVVLREGRLPMSLRASMSIPGVFEPVKEGDMVLIDGGINNNFPVDVVRQMGAEIVIGVDLSQGEKGSNISSMIDIIDQLTSVAGREKYLKNKEICDLYINPDLKPYSTSSFTKDAVRELLKRGHTTGESVAERLDSLKKIIWNGKDVQYVRQITEILPYNDTNEIRIGKIVIEGVSQKASGVLLRNLGLESNTYVRRTDLSRAIAMMRETGAFENISYNLNLQYPYTLTIQATEVNKRVLDIGLRFDTEEMAASVLLNTRVVFNGEINGSVNLRGRVSKNPYVRLSTTLGRVFLGQMEFSYKYEYNNFDLKNEGRTLRNIQFGANKLRLTFSSLSIRNFKTSLGIEYEHYSKQSGMLDTLVTNYTQTRVSDFVNYYFTASYNSLSDPYYPYSGHLFEAKYFICTDGFLKYKGENPPGALSLNIMSAIKLNKYITILPEFRSRLLFNSLPDVYSNYIGGAMPGRYFSQQIPFAGIADLERSSRNLITFGVDLRVEPVENNYLTFRGNYGAAVDDLQRIYSGKRYFGASLGWSVNTVGGPIEVTLGRSNRGRALIYLSIGRFF